MNYMAAFRAATGVVEPPRYTGTYHYCGQAINEEKDRGYCPREFIETAASALESESLDSVVDIQ